METPEIKLECLKLITGEPDVTIHIAKADMLYQYCMNDKIPSCIGLTSSELTDIVYKSIKERFNNSNNTSDCID